MVGMDREGYGQRRVWTEKGMDREGYGQRRVRRELA